MKPFDVFDETAVLTEEQVRRLGFLIVRRAVRAGKTAALMAWRDVLDADRTAVVVGDPQPARVGGSDA